MNKTSATDSQPMVKMTKKQVTFILLLVVWSLIAVGLLHGLIKPKWSLLFVIQPIDIVSDEEPWLDIRLPRHILPVHYDLTLFPDFYQPDRDYAPVSYTHLTLPTIYSV